MAIYLTKQIELSDVQILDIKFHQKLELLAISVIKNSSIGRLIIANNKGDIFDSCKISKDQPTSTILWHPMKAIIAIGWSDGQISIFDETQNVTSELLHIHVLPIASFSWSSHGSNLISADIEGHLYAWKIDSRGGSSQTPLYSFNANCAINCILLRMPRLKGSDVYDIRELAKAAVSGDERALDLMSWTKNNSGIRLTGYSYIEVSHFFAGLADGSVILINEDGKVTNITSLEGSVVRLLYHEERDVLIATTDIGMLTQHQLLSDGSSREVMKVKLASRTPNPSLIWAGSSTLAISLGESMIRMWDIDREENYMLQADEAMGYLNMGLLSVIDYCPSQKTIVAGSNKGQIAMWKMMGNEENYSKDNPETRWHLQPATNIFLDEQTLGGSIEKIVASFTNVIVASTSTNTLHILEERSLVSAFSNGIVVTQKAAKELFVQLYHCCIEPTENKLFINDEQPQETISESTKSFTIVVDHLISHMDCSKENLAISDGSFVYAYELKSDSQEAAVPCGQFESSSNILKIHQQNIYVYEKSELQIRNFQGIIKQIVDLGNMDGKLTLININNNFMVCATDKCCLRTYDLSRRDPKPLSPIKDFGDSLPSVTQIKSISINCNGTCVSLIIAKQKLPDPKLYFWDIEADSIQYFNFATGLGDQDDFVVKKCSKTSKDSRSKSGRKSARLRNRRRRNLVDSKGDAPFSVTQSILYNDNDVDEDGEDENTDSDGDETQQNNTYSSNEHQESLLLAKDVAGSLPISHYWDKIDHRLIVVEIKSEEDQKLNFNFSPASDIDKKIKKDIRVIVSLFATQDDGILMFDNTPCHEDYEKLIGFDAPNYFFAIRNDIAYRRQFTEGSNNSFIALRVMRDFVGLENSDKTNKQALLNFSYYLTIGNMDEAFKSMKLIKSELVWQNMARMCVKTRRLDVATVCLGKMNYACAAMQLREARQNIPQLDAKVAMLALHLDMKDEAIRLLEKAQRYDILNELYQAMEEWNKALDLAQKHDRIHLKTTFYNYAKYLEEQKRYSEAIENFVKSGTHAFEVPRMLFDQPEELEKFIRERPEKSLRNWWAQYMECCGEMKIALEFYAAAQDNLSLVRAYWLLGMEKKATEVCNDTGDKAACYHLARQFEAANNIDQAIHYFSRAKAYNSAIRLCKENKRDDHLVNLALLGKLEDQVEAATYLQNRSGYQDKAVILFHKAGQISRAIDLAFKTKQFGALQQISNDLSDKVHPDLLQKCASFFMENNQFDRAVDMLASSKQLWDALKLCVEYNVPMTEELAEKLSPLKPSDNSQQTTISRVNSNPQEYTETERLRLLEGIAEIALSQRQYHLACKKFTQAGNQMMAMKSLLKSGDTAKIVFFANVAKTKEVYVLAANYLQTLDWRRDPDIMKNIILFYTKGKALERLASFYEACAQSEIEEYQNYGKAIGALGEAFKYWSKIKFESDSQKNQKLDQIKDKCTAMKKFVCTIEMFATNPDTAIHQCQLLLDEPQIDRAVRYGDIYGQMINHFMQQNKLKAAYSCLEEMKRNIRNPGVVTAYIDISTLETLHKSLGIPFRQPTQIQSEKKQYSDNEDDVIDDEIAAAIDED